MLPRCVLLWAMLVFSVAAYFYTPSPYDSCKSGSQPTTGCLQIGLNFYCNDSQVCENVGGSPGCCSSQSRACSDTLSSGCSTFRNFGKCTNKAISQFCKLTCNLCETTCQDTFSDCATYQKSNLCDTLVGYVNCTDTCGYCNGTRPTPSLAPLPGCQDYPVFDCLTILYTNQCGDAFFKTQACRSTCGGCTSKGVLEGHT
ncbi:hypothetical protein L596_022856 [Steinernema carpocapsae]|uniref:ShKT domain-containing protein n=1 Tax=Steinernema carpocapsae TaxID=34508 RepID=A0A4U5MBP6_STECR|nr:hypothetical protein L596_022856 [Steinernema carpocapsae]